MEHISRPLLKCTVSCGAGDMQAKKKEKSRIVGFPMKNIAKCWVDIFEKF